MTTTAISKTSIMVKLLAKQSSPTMKLVSCIDAYHSIDYLCEAEETKFDIRNAALVQINSIRTRVPIAVRQYISQWLYDKNDWLLDKRNLV